MFSCSRYETARIMDGRAIGAVRKYGEFCPHKAGDTIVMTSKFLDFSGQGRSIPFAKATVVSVRPGTVGEFGRDELIAQMDGFASCGSWKDHFKVFYGGVSDSDKAFHIKFRIDQIDKDAGRRPDVGDEDIDPERIVR